MRTLDQSRFMRRAGEFYLRHSIRRSVTLTTLIVTSISFGFTLAMQLIFGPRFDRGFWIGLGIATVLPLVITPPITNVIVTLVHELRRANEAAYDLANIDYLTKFKTRRRFLVEATEAIDRASVEGKPLTLLMLDIDNFKRVNDTYGHLTGDRVLAEVAGVCRSTLASGDIMARLGGDEMALLLTDATLKIGADVAERIRVAVAESQVRNHVPGQDAHESLTIGVTVSIGGAPFHVGESLDELFMYADQALYRAKDDGRNRVRLSEPLGGSEVSRSSLTS